MKNLKFGMLISIVVAAIVAAVVFSGCGKKAESTGIKLDVTYLPAVVTDSLYIKMSYAFTISEKFEGLSDDYRVFVHFWRVKKKEMLMQDDHEPDKKFSEWKKGDTFTYSRRLFIPRFLDEFDLDFEGNEVIKLTVGIHKPGVEDSKINLFECNMPIQSASLNAPEIVYDQGWNQQETDPKIPNKDEREWRWTSQKAVCIIENPRKDSLLKIRGGVDKGKIPDQKVIFKLNDTLLEEFIPESGKFDKEYVLTQDMLGNEDEIKLIIETDKTFVPSALNPDVKDDRELGVQIYFLYFREHVK